MKTNTDWKTHGIKHMSDGTVLRLQGKFDPEAGTSLRRVQQLHRFPFLGWCTLPEELSLREALMFNCPTRLALREGTDETLEACTNNVMLPHYSFLPLTDPRAERYIVSRYATVEDDFYYCEELRQWRSLKNFFVQPKPEPVFEKRIRLSWLDNWRALVACGVIMLLALALALLAQ